MNKNKVKYANFVYNLKKKSSLDNKIEIMNTKKELKRKRDLGPDWHQFKPDPMSNEIINDLRALDMRNQASKERIVKQKEDTDQDQSKRQVQVGQVVNDINDFFDGNQSNSNKKISIVENMILESKINKVVDKKYDKLQKQDKVNRLLSHGQKRGGKNNKTKQNKQRK